MPRTLNGWTPLRKAAYQGQKDAVELLPANCADADVNRTSGFFVQNGQTPLHLAMMAQRFLAL
jgi:ankyrin repeat protein